MPMRPRSRCTVPLCVERSPCPVHGRARFIAYDAARGPAYARGYDAAWRALRAVFVRQHPNCQAVGCAEPTHEVHHRVPVKQAPELRLEWSNLVALCASHHRRAEAAVRGAPNAL